MPVLAVPALESVRVYGEGLDDVIVHVWDELAEDRDAACPVCGGDMEPVYSAGPRAVGGRCKQCGSSLS